MNLAVNGLRGEIKKANTYYEDPHKSFGAFDYVLANPPFNVDDVSLSSVEKDKRFNTYGIPRNKIQSQQGGRRQGNRPQRKLSLDQSLCHLAEAQGPRRARHGEFGLRCPPFRGRHPPDVDRERISSTRC